MWPIALSGRLPVAGTVGLYPAVYLMGRDPIPSRLALAADPCGSAASSGISLGFPRLSRWRGQVGHVLLTRSPLHTRPKASSPFDLHVLGTPPAFILSQDQTLRSKDPRRGPWMLGSGLARNCPFPPPARRRRRGPSGFRSIFFFRSIRFQGSRGRPPGPRRAASGETRKETCYPPATLPSRPFSDFWEKFFAQIVPSYAKSTLTCGFMRAASRQLAYNTDASTVLQGLISILLIFFSIPLATGRPP